MLTHHQIEGLLSKRLEERGYLNDWEAKIEKIDRADGLRDLARIKNLTDQMVMASDGILFNIAYPFNENRLQPIHLRNPSIFDRTYNDTIGMSEKILYLPAGRQGGNLNLPLER